MGRTVLLLHQLPDGSSHFDWLTQCSEGGRLLSFRVRERIDDPSFPAGGRFDAEAMPDHRPVYLEYEGPVSGGRGTVRRVAAGSAEVESASASGIVVLVDFGAGPRRLAGEPAAEPDGGRGDPAGSAWWRFTVTPLEREAPAR